MYPRLAKWQWRGLGSGQFSPVPPLVPRSPFPETQAPERVLAQWVGFDVEIAILYEQKERRMLVETIQGMGLPLQIEIEEEN
jgi:hypothetical protein